MVAKVHNKFGIRMLGAGVSLIAVGAGAEANATCVLSGNGTLANIGPSSAVNCTATTTGATLSTTANAQSNVFVIVLDDAVLGSSTITMQGGGDQIIVAGAPTSTSRAGVITDSDITLSGANSVLSLRSSAFPAAGGQVLNSTPHINLISGANALVDIQQNALMSVAQPMQFTGVGSQLRLTGGAFGASGSYTGYLAQGGAGANTFDLGGEVFGRQAAGIVQAIDGGGGADVFIFNGSTLFTESTNAPNTAFLFDGGAGADVLNLTNENTTLARFNTTGIETLNKTGPGRFNLNGTHDFADINVTGAGAILDVTGGLASLGASNAAINIDSGASLVLNQSTAGTLTQSISGAGTLFKDGGGVLTIGQPNTGFSGHLNISSGGATITDSGALGTGTITLNGTLNVGDIAFANSITGGGGTVVKSGAGVTTLGGVNLHGDTQVNDGRLIATGITALGRGSVTLAAGSILEINQATAASGNGIIVGAGALVKSGLGDLTLTNAGCCNLTAFSGGTSITGGRLILGASSSGAGLGAGDIDISAGAAFQLSAHTVANTITGAGAVEKGSTGVGILTGTNTHTGGTQVLGGTLQTTSAAPLGSGDVDISGGATFNLANATTMSLANALSGAGTFDKTGAGDLVLSTANAGLTGTTRISAGRIILNDGGALGSSAVVNDAQLRIGDIAVANNISGSGSVEKTASSLGTLSGANTYSGGTSVMSGTLRAVGGGALGTGAVSLASGAVLDLNQTGSGSMSNAITGAGAVIKTGAGDLVMQGAGTYSGGTTVGAGRLVLNNGAALGSGTVVNNANLRIGNVTVDNTITGTGAVEKTSSGLGALTGANTYSGGTTVTAGTLRADSLSSIGTGAVNIGAAGTFNINNAGSTSLANALAGTGSLLKSGAGDLILGSANAGFSGNTTIATGRVILNNGGALGGGDVINNAALRIGDIAVGNNISGSGSVEKTSSGVGTLSGANTYTGGTSVANGTLRVTGTSALGTGAVNVAGGATLSFDHAVSGTVAGAISGAGNVTKTGAGTTTLSGANTFSGGASIQQGALEVTTGAALGTGTVAVSSGASLRFNNAGDTQLTNVISGAGSVVKSGAGTAEFLTANTYSGGTDIQQGAIRITDVAQLGSGGISVQTGAALDFSIAGNATLNQTISGAGLMRKSNTGELTLLGNTLTGGVDITEGRVRVTESSALGAGGVTASSGAALIIDNASVDQFSTSLSGAGALAKTGAGDLILSGQNDFSGGATISAGRIILNNGNALGSGAVVNDAALRIGNVSVANAISGTGTLEKTSSGVGAVSGVNSFTGGTTVAEGTLRADGSAALGAGAVSIASGATLDINTATASQMANVLSGAGTLVKSGAGDLALNGSAAARTGLTTIAAGRLIVNSNSALGSGAVVNNASLRLGDVALANGISGTGSVEKTSVGVGALSGVNTYSGGTMVSAGTLRTTALSALGTGGLSIASGATFEFDSATDATLGIGVSGAGTFSKLGLGALTLSSPLSIGTLAVNSGRVRVNAALTGNATVASGATLDGTGSITGSLTNSGALAPGNSIGVLTVGGDFAQTASGVLEIEFDTAGSRMDLLQVGGRAVLGGTVRFISTDASEAFGGTFLNAAGGISGQFDSVEIQGATLPVTVLYGAATGSVAPTVLSARPSTFNSQLLAASDTSFAFVEGVAGRRDHTTARNGLWFDTFAAEGARDAHESTLGYDHSSTGFAIGGGAETKMPGLSLGGAIGWSDTEIDLDQRAGGGTQESLMLAAYLSYKAGPTRWTGGLLLGAVDQETVRNVSFNSVTTSITGETDSGLFGAFASLEQDLGAWAGWTFSGKLNADYVQQTQDAYVESGLSPLRLSIEERGFDTYQAEALVESERTFVLGNGQTITPRFGMGVGQTTAGGSRIIPVEFAASGAGVDLQGDTRAITQAITNASLAWQISGNATVTFDYNGRFGDASSHLARLGVGFQF